MNKEGGKQRKTFSVIKRMCACASVNSPRNSLLLPNAPVTELVVIDLAKSERRAGNGTCKEWLWLPLQAVRLLKLRAAPRLL